MRVESEPVRNFSAAFELSGTAEQGRLALTSPLGTTLAEARWSPTEAVLVHSNGTQPYADIDSLAEQALGERVPIAALFHWLRGRPWPAAPSLPFDGEAGFTQIGWRVSLARLADGWVDARRDAAPVVTVRARLDPALTRSTMTLRALHDVPAPAKLNLFLHVVGRRPDGYHLLQSVFVLIDWFDTLSFECRDDGVLERIDLGPALPADDLSLRAARALQQASGTRLGATLRVDKCVPWGAGLGGGSSDAATTLLALNRLWGLHWPRARAAPTGGAAGRRRAVLRGRPQRLRRRHRRAAHAGRAAGAVAGRGEATTGHTHRGHIWQPAAGSKYRSCYTRELSRGRPHYPSRATLGRVRPQRPAASRRKPEFRGDAGRQVAGSPLRQQPDVGFGQCGVRESRYGRSACGDMVGG